MARRGARPRKRKAKGSFEGTSNKADYELNMQYNRLNGIVKKALQYTLNGEDKGYTLNYEYNDKKHPHAPSSISGIAPFGGQGAGKPRNYTYDSNGNPTYYDEFKGFRSMVWDEENRLRGINDNGRLHLYTYDHTGERALKSSAESSMAVINGLASAVITHTEDYTAYVNPYFVVQKGKFTKHYFEGSSRIVSKLGEGTFSQNKPKITAGGIDYFARTQKEQEARDRYIKGLNVPPGPPTQHGIYATPEWTKQPYPSIDWETISQNQEPPQGWPRYPKFNEPGDVPGPPVQFGEPLTNANVRAGFNFIPNGVEEKNIYYYHPDHLGSSSYITDKNGEIVQHTEYMAFGETFVDEHSVSPTQPYLFNGKELDYETGLYYYGARYYDAKVSIFLNVDPLAEKYPEVSPYTYTLNNPIKYIDPDGKDIRILLVNTIKVVKKGEGNYTNGPNHFKLYTTKARISKHLASVMRKFVKSKEAQKFLLQYMKKGQSFYGITATENGKLSNYNLNIYDVMNNNEIDEKYRAVMASGPYIANALTSFDSETGDINVYIGTSQSKDVDYTTETLAHELGQHAVNHSKYIKLNKGNKKELNEELKKDYYNDHSESKNKEGAKVYNKIMKELNLEPKWSEK